MGTLDEVLEDEKAAMAERIPEENFAGVCTLLMAATQSSAVHSDSSKRVFIPNVYLCDVDKKSTFRYCFVNLPTLAPNSSPGIVSMNATH